MKDTSFQGIPGFNETASAMGTKYSKTSETEVDLAGASMHILSAMHIYTKVHRGTQEMQNAAPQRAEHSLDALVRTKRMPLGRWPLDVWTN